MPVGVPKVPYFFPDDDDGSWLDLYNRLYYERLLFLTQEITPEISNQLVGLMVYLSIEDKDRDLFLFINSPGGNVTSGRAIFNTMHFVEANVQTVCVGTAASMASLILAGGQITKRLAFPHARVMIHQPASSYQDGRTEECMLGLDEISKIHDEIVETYAQITGKPPWQISEDMKRDSFMSAEEARAYGIIDIVAADLD
uniref:ATP-dependent Clp protease proteolytic subunit n=1 Tax=Astragalus psilosepalus TaxID=3077617 RepID=A0AA96H992_9FABA|nr:ATP-dependent Clp protease proteolytic subunit [Astragalus psilosepalus]WNM88754.1 ATP-dependent Clp protease proteolytic subunit [Astragalus psilosepalus]